MSLVSVFGPNTFGVSGAGTGGSGGPVTENAQVRVTADNTNGLKFTVEAVNKQRPAADYDWVLTGGTPGTKADDRGPFVVTYASAGLKTISLTIAAGAGPPPGGTYNITVTAVSGPRSVQEEGDEQPIELADVATEVGGEYNPSDHTAAEINSYADDHADDYDEIQRLLDAEVADKGRTTVISHLEALLPYDPGQYTIPEVVKYAETYPDQLEEILQAERDGKNRSTLVSHLESLRPA